MGSKFRKAGTDLSRWRDIDGFIIRNTSVPENTIIEPTEIDHIYAEWVYTDEVISNAAVIYLHGGGFIMGSPKTHREMAARLARASRTKMLVVDYRLAPENPFPAALLDVVTTFEWLLGKGFSAHQVVIGGDSAGGGLPPMCIHVGEREILLSDSIRLAERARAAGVEVELKVWPGMWHVFQSNARFVPESRQSIDEIGHFVQDSLRRST